MRIFGLQMCTHVGAWQTTGEQDMAQSDLLNSLVPAGSSGAAVRSRALTDAIIKELAKSHNVLADRLTDAMRVNYTGSAVATLPRKRLADVVLSDLARGDCDELIEEQHWASVLCALSLEPAVRAVSHHCRQAEH